MIWIDSCGDGYARKQTLGQPADDWTYTVTTPPSGPATCSGSGTFYAAGSAEPDGGPVAITNADVGVAVFGVGGTVPGPLCPDFTAPRNLLQVTYVSNDSVTSQGVVNTFSDGQSDFMPLLQRSDGGYIGTHSGGSVVLAVGPSGILWQQEFGTNPTVDVVPLYATSDGGVVLTSTPQTCPPGDIVLPEGPGSGGCLSGALLPGQSPSYGQLGTLYTLDPNGNIVSQAPDIGAMQSWGGESYAASAGAMSEVSPPVPLVRDDANFAAQIGGNPSNNGAASPECPCDLQLADQELTGDPPPGDPPAEPIPANCPFCALASPTCMSLSQNGPVYLILIGDQGMPPHDVGYKFDLAAQQRANDVGATNYVIACRVSGINDVIGALKGTLSGESLNGHTIGGIVYFGHSGPSQPIYANGIPEQTTALFVGQAHVEGTNIDGSNYYLLPTLGSGITFEIDGCEAAKPISEWYTGAYISIGQLIADSLAINVKAWKVGMYFSNRPAASDPHNGRTDNPPDTLPMYSVPIGKKYHKPPPILISPRKTGSN